MEELRFLEEQQVSPELIRQAEEFRNTYTTDEAAVHRIVKPSIPFYGKEILEMGLAAGLLRRREPASDRAEGNWKKCAGRESGFYFRAGRLYNVSFHVNTNSGDLIGTDTFVDNEVKLRKGTVFISAPRRAALESWMRSIWQKMMRFLSFTLLLDYRRSIDVPGYDRIDLHPAARFLGTMNYGYAGTKELNEALVSRFMVVDMPAQNEETLGFHF